MSLILEALKKLDREKQAPDRGFLVVAHAPWPSSKRRRAARLAVVATLAILLGLGGAALLLRPSAGVAVKPAPRVSAPVAPEPASTASASGIPERPRPPAPEAPIRSRSAPSAQAPTTRRQENPVSAPPSVPTDAAGPLQLQAISAQEGQPVAVVNGRLVREGDSFDGVRILRIGADEVEIETQGRRRVLRF